MSAAASAALATREAVEQARVAFVGGARPKLAILFVSVSYDDVAMVAPVVRELLGPIPVVGGSSGACVFDSDACARRGVSVVLLGGDDLEVEVRTAALGSPDFVEVVPAAEAIARAADDADRRGFPHYACLVFAPGVSVDGEAFVAAVRKGAGARAQLAGGLTGDDLTLDRTKVLADGELRSDRVVVTGLFTRHPIGIAARHGWRAAGPIHTVTRADGRRLVHLDGRPAARVWVEDALNAGASPPDDMTQLPLYLANHYELGIIDVGAKNGATEHELVARAPFAISDEGVVQLSASIAEGTRVRILHASRSDLLEASVEAAAEAVRRSGSHVVGALVLACSGRLAALGDAFPEEPLAIGRRIGGAIGGACVFGEIARNVRDSDAFFNTTAVVVAFGD
jgi:hypothetical protein